MPLVVAIALEVINPTYMATLISDPRGKVILLLSGFLLLLAFLTMRYLMRRVTRL
jgi:Flp pilus assembly protein TadB